MLKKRKHSSRQLLNLASLSEYGIKGYNEVEKVFYIIDPPNLSVLSDESIATKVFSLTNVLKSLAEIEMLCLNSKDNFIQNKTYIQSRIENEENEAIRELLRKDLNHLDKIQIQTATARLFLLIISIKPDENQEVNTLLKRIEKLLKIQNFSVHRASKEELKSLLGVYLEQNVTTDHFDDIDGERWYDQIEDK